MKVFNYAVSFIMGLLTGYLVFFLMNYKLFIASVSPVQFRIGDDNLLEVIMFKNLQFALALYLLGFDVYIQYFILFLAGLISGFLLSIFKPICAILAVVFHGPLEIMGYAFTSMGGYETFSRKRSFKMLLINYLIPGVILIMVAAYMEVFVTFRYSGLFCSLLTHA